MDNVLKLVVTFGNKRFVIEERFGPRAWFTLQLIKSALLGTRDDFTKARILYDRAHGLSLDEVASRLGISKKTLWEWRRRIKDEEFGVGNYEDIYFHIYS